MKATNLNPLFIDQVQNFAHLLTTENQSKNEFLTKIRTTYSVENPKTQFFYTSVLLSDFESIRLNRSKNAILFNQ